MGFDDVLMVFVMITFRSSAERISKLPKWTVHIQNPEHPITNVQGREEYRFTDADFMCIVPMRTKGGATSTDISINSGEKRLNYHGIFGSSEDFFVRLIHACMMLLPVRSASAA